MYMGVLCIYLLGLIGSYGYLWLIAIKLGFGEFHHLCYFLLLFAPSTL